MVELRRLGHDVLTTVDAGKAEQAISDDQVLGFATSDGRCLLTLNRRHFVSLHQQNPTHTGIIVCTFDATFIAQAGRIHTAIEEAGKLTNKLLRVNRPRA